ncbi:isochorismatase family protein [Pedobacter soli]|uniref:Nicotinamidase-related amidase n=1 Tax=Pedobacter soli TaxID=390242 RepID=A0A1G7CWV8_9SPHI|nr:isochorismatase family protein [Pedobacter soli]SDE43741.1 Nicotinamidase-related amidase [Pedobacter soli]
MKALLIIDMQIGSFKPYDLRYDTLGVIERINKISNYFRKNSDQVIFIQHDGSKENIFLPHTSDWKLLPELIKCDTDHVVSKSANDAFYNTHLNEILFQNNISELYIAGCATDFCVDSTVKSAITRDYNVTVIEDAHTTADRPHLSAVKIIEHYNWIWSEMTPTNFKVKVIKTNDVAF